MISTNIQKIKSEIKKNCELSGKDPEKLVLIGASKSQPVEKIQEAYEAGLKNFGENYLQEAESKIGKLSKTIIWHFIGSVQSRKAKKIAEIFDWVHTLDSLKVARKLNDARPKSKGALNVCIQVNIDLEETKSGIHEKDLENFLEETLSLENIKVRGRKLHGRACNSCTLLDNGERGGHTPPPVGKHAQLARCRLARHTTERGATNWGHKSRPQFGGTRATIVKW